MSKETEKNETKDESLLRALNELDTSHLEMGFLNAKHANWKGNPNINAKNTLQEYSQKFRFPIPKYELIKNEGSLFTVEVIVKGYLNEETVELRFTGEGSSKTQAEIQAAKKACDRLKLKYKP